MSSIRPGAPEAPSIIPTLQPKWKRSVTSDDVQPSLVTSSGDVCGVCQQHESRYTCPRCGTPYCSVSCYKEHDSDKASCTESFYQERVSDVLRLEAKEHEGSMKGILSRSQQALAQDEGFDQEDDDHVSEDDLWRLAEALENGAITDEDADRLLTPEIRLAFERAVKSGELSNSIEPWHPWWTLEFASDEQDENLSNTSKKCLTLDERLLKIPPFSSLRPGPLPLLWCNMVDLLYSVALTLRLYHGVDNAVAACQEASSTLVQSSAVLSSDARHSTVAEALMACTSLQEHRGNTHWTVLARDVVYLCNSSRHMSHALLDSIDIVKAATKALKRKGDTEQASPMRRIQKKLEYYLSWCRAAQLPENLEDEIKAWIEEWKGCMELDESDSLWLPKTREQARRGESNPNSRKITESLELTEVSSKRIDRKGESNL